MGLHSNVRVGSQDTIECAERAQPPPGARVEQRLKSERTHCDDDATELINE